MMKLLVFGFLLIGFACNAQIKNISIHAGINHPFIQSVENNNQTMSLPIPAATGYSYTTLKIAIKESFSGKTGFAFGGRFDYPITARFFLTSGLSCSYLLFKRTITVANLPSGIEMPRVIASVGQPFGTIYSQNNPNASPVWMQSLHSSEHGNSSLLSLQTPILIGASFFNERLQVRTGALFSYLLYSTEVKSKYNVADNSISEYKDSSKEGFNGLQAGASVQTSYVFGGKIGIDLSAQKFFTAIYKSDNQQGGKGKYGVVSLGLSYAL